MREGLGWIATIWSLAFVFAIAAAPLLAIARRLDGDRPRAGAAALLLALAFSIWMNVAVFTLSPFDGGEPGGGGVGPFEAR